jgi:hypothetical protein
MKQNGYWTKTNQKKANTFAEHFVKVFTSNIRKIIPEEEEAIFNH